MLKIFNLKNDFIKNALILVTGSGISQLVPLAFSPILTRIYSPGDFGKLAFYMAWCSILGVLSTGLYELSIMKAKKETAAFNIMMLIMLLSTSLSFLLLLFVICYHFFFATLFVIPLNFITMLFIPLGVFSTGMFQALNYWFNRKKQYKLLNICKIMQSSGIVLMSIFIGLFGNKQYGLIGGFVCGSIFGILPLVTILYKKSYLFSWVRIKSLAYQNISYPKLLMPATMMNTTASQAPVFFITKYFSAQVVGSFSFASRILTAPVGVISVAIGQIYFKAVSDITNAVNKLVEPTFVKTAKTLFAVSLILFLPFLIFGAEIFKFIFGDQWKTAGEYVQILSVAVFVKFIVSPLSSVFVATGNLKWVTSWQTTYFLTTLTIFYLGRSLDFANLLKLYVAHEIVLYSLYFFLMYIVVRRFDFNVKQQGNIV